MAQLVGRPPATGKVVGSIVAGSVLAQGTNERQLIDVSLSHGCFSPSLPLSLKINKIKIKFF